MDRLTQPEYTGENRCTPCTVVNVVIAALIAAALGLVSVPLGVVAFLVGLGVIYLRGYLVPYTPALTKRYFPDRVLRWFEKEPVDDGTMDGDWEQDFDVSAALLEIGVITECENVDDLCLESTFQTAWRQQITDLRESDRDDRRREIADLLDLDDESEINEYGHTAAIVQVDGTQVGQWESDAALIADLAADRTLREWDVDWGTYHVVNRSQMLNTLRMFLERCPSCDAPVSIGQETVESCCRSRDVAAVTCDACAARLFEIELTDQMQAQL
jgi:hypothetical protein